MAKINNYMSEVITLLLICFMFSTPIIGAVIFSNSSRDRRQQHQQHYMFMSYMQWSICATLVSPFILLIITRH